MICTDKDSIYCTICGKKVQANEVCYFNEYVTQNCGNCEYFFKCKLNQEDNPTIARAKDLICNKFKSDQSKKIEISKNGVEEIEKRLGGINNENK